MFATSRGIFPVLLAVSLLLAAAACHAAPASNIRQFSIGHEHICAVTGAGELLCWGRNTYGQIGYGKADSSGPDSKMYDPAQIIPHGVTAVSAGANHTCAIASGALYCWGANDTGEIGNGEESTKPVLSPVKVISGNVKAVSVGDNHTCAIVGSDLQCWGANWQGQVGIGVLRHSPLKPVTVIKGGVTAVSAGMAQTCAVVRGDLWCWGENLRGELGNGRKGQNMPSPIKIISGGVTAVQTGPYFETCAIVRGALQCWGENQQGELDPDTKGDLLTPKTFIPSGVTAVALGGNNICAVVRSALQCWGYVGTIGYLGIANQDNNLVIKHPRELIPGGVTAVGMGGISCVLVNGALRCRGWDANLYGLPPDSQVAPYTDGKWDVHVLSHAASDKVIAQGNSQDDIAYYLRTHPIIYRVGVVYYLREVNANVDRADPADRDLSLKLEMQAIPLFRSTRFDDRNKKTITLAPNTGCVLDGGKEQALETTEFYVWTGSRFDNLHNALLPSVPVQPEFYSYDNALKPDAHDSKRIQACAQHVSARLDQLPFRSVSYTLNNLQDVEAPATLSPQYAAQDRGWVRHLQINNTQGNLKDYSVQAYTDSAMQCGKLVLTKWKHWQSPGLTLGERDTLLDVNSALLLAKSRMLPAYDEMALRRAIRAEQGQAGLAGPEEARKCLPAVIGERLVVKYQGTTLQQFSIALPAPVPALVPDCDHALQCKDLQGAHGKRIVLQVLSSFGARRFGDPAPDPNADRQDDDTGSPDTFGARGDSGQDNNSSDESAAPAGQPDSYDLALFVVDGNSGQIDNRYLQKKAYVSGKLNLNRFTLDTGRYFLAAGTRAFGVRAEYTDPNSLTPQGETTLKLFVRDGNALRPVLDGLVMNKRENKWKGGCSGASTRVSRIIDIGKSSSHGYADLVVTSTVKVTQSRMAGGQCAEQTLPPRSETATLHYDGRHYIIPAALRMTH